jgi:hypothetical protein
MSVKLIVKQFSTFALILLWVYAAVSKLIDYPTAKAEMLNQVFPDAVALLMVWAVPAVELLTAMLLVVPRTVYIGHLVSCFLLLSFSVYIALGLFNVYSRMPCTCGGIISQLTWVQHLAFNLFFFGLTLVTIIIYRRERRVQA